MTRIAVDMDNVLAETLGAQLSWFRKTYRYSFIPDDLRGKRFQDLFHPEHLAVHEVMLHEGSFFGTLKVVSGAVQIMAALDQHYELFVASAAMEFPRSCDAKFAWLQQHFPFIPPHRIVFCGDKSVLGVDYLIDDCVQQLQRFRGRGLLFTSPLNSLETGYQRVESWEEIGRLFLGAEPSRAVSKAPRQSRPPSRSRSAFRRLGPSEESLP